MKELDNQQKKRKFLLECKDILVGAAFPFMVLVIFSVSIMAFASLDELTVQLLATIGGELLIIIAYFIFGKNNGATAYRKYILNSKKRELGSSDENAILHIGEYALWKGLVIGFITTIPFIILQIINLATPNSFTQFLLLYACGWAYYPLNLFDVPQAFNFILIIIPIATHIVGYVYGKNREIVIQQKIAEESNKSKRKRK